MEEFSFEKRHEQFVYVLNSKILNQLEYYTYLHKSNSQDLKETIRFISEELVWSDQNQRSFFDDFKFKNTLSCFSKLIKDSKVKEIQIQLIQSANILIHNLSVSEHKSNKYTGFLLASDFFKLLIKIKFNFSDDEIVENYMSFLKGMAANLPSDLLISYVVHTNFAFFKRAFMFFYHSDPMFKNAARTGILRILKRNIQTENDPRVFEYLHKVDFFSEILKNVLNHWDKFHFLINREEKFKRDFYITSISDDLCYLNDLMYISEELHSQILQKFFSLCFSWILSKISEISKKTQKFNGIGFILFSIFQHIQSRPALDAIATCLFSSEISEKVQDLLRGKGSYQEDYLNDERKVRNEVKTQMQNIMKNGENITVGLILVNVVAGNKNVSKKVMFECCLLGKKEVKSQLLLRKILQNNEVYASDKFLTMLLVSIICSQQTVFNVFLACRLIFVCKLHPEEEKMSMLREKITGRVLEIAKELKKNIGREKNPDFVLEAFENGCKFASELSFSNKVKFPNELLYPIEATTPLKFRIPIGQKEVYLWHFNILFIIGTLNSELFYQRKFEYFDQIVMNRKSSPPVQAFECRNQEKIEIYEFFLSIHQGSQEKIVNLSRSEVELDPTDTKIIHILSSESKNPYSIKLEFEDNDNSEQCKKLTDQMIKESKTNELKMLTDHLESFIQI